MTDQLLNALKIVLLGFIYLFFGRVLWAVWSEVRTPVQPMARKAGEKSSSRRATKGMVSFVVIEPKEHRGEVFTLSNVLTIGRDDACTISMPGDAFMSGMHARVEIRPEGTWVVDTNSTNGVYVNGQRISMEKSLRKGDRVQAGSTVLETRS